MVVGWSERKEECWLVIRNSSLYLGWGDEHVTAGLSVGGEVGVENPAFPPAKR